MSWLREAISDENGQCDIAYVAIGILTSAACVALTFICAMSAISYHQCKPITAFSSAGVSSVIPCNFDPLPIGQAAGLIFGAFATLIGALAAYMAATRKQRLVRTDGGT